MHGQHTNVAGKIKVYVVGPFQAGKTTLVHSLDPKAVSIERIYKHGSTIISTTVGFDMGRVLWLHGDEDKIIESSKLRREDLKSKNMEIWEVTLMGAPGQLHFKNVREAIAKGSDGVLFVIDSTKPGQAGYIFALLEEIRNFLGDNIPMVLIANKQDLKNALKAERIREILKLDGVKIIEASAIKGEGVMEGLIELLKMIRETRLKK
ncbi:MAG: GTP-binding protein [Candidatus Baldrarchaeia archaeon]